MGANQLDPQTLSLYPPPPFLYLGKAFSLVCRLGGNQNVTGAPCHPQSLSAPLK